MTRLRASISSLGRLRNALAAALCFGAALFVWSTSDLPTSGTFQHANPLQGIASLRLETLRSEPFKLEADAERMTLIYFWASWCIPCQMEMPKLDELSADYGDSLRVLGINFGENRAAAAQFASEMGVSYTLLLDIEGEAAHLFRVRQVPTSFLLDEDLALIHVYYGVFSKDQALRDMARALEQRDA